MLWTVLAGFLAAPFAPLLAGRPDSRRKWLLPLVPLALFIYFCTHILAITGTKAVASRHPWIPGLGIGLDFRLDGLSLLFALIITGVGTLILLYANHYLGESPRLGRLQGHLLAFMGSMLGLVLTSNLIALYVFWELTGLFSFFLIGFEKADAKARQAAWTALIITALGGLSMLAGLLLLARMGGTLDMEVLLARGGELRELSLYAPAFLLIAFGAFTKSAQFPFHFWLPEAMRAPTPVSAYLHSATMVKAGVYLLARLGPVLGGTLLWRDVLVTAGVLTMLVSAWLALSQIEFKALLAYGTLWALGTLTALIGIGTAQALEVAMVLLVAHSLYKACLFMVAGILSHQTGEKDAERLGGLGKAMPWTCAAALAGAVSMAGLPPSIGFIAKELLLSAEGHAGPVGMALLAAAVVSGMSLFFIAAMVAFRPFFPPSRATASSPPSSSLRLPREAGAAFLLGPLLLGALGLVFGISSWPLSRELLSPAVSAVLGREEWVELSLWHGLNLALVLSLVTLAGGLGLYLHRARLRARLSAPPFTTLAAAGPARLSLLLGRGVMALARGQTRLLQSGNLRFYLVLTVAALLGAIGYAFLSVRPIPPPFRFTPVLWQEAALTIFMAAAALVVVVAKSRMLAVGAMGSVGFGMVLLFVHAGAPDLAMTQFLVEIVTVLLLLLAFYHLPRFQSRTGPSARALTAGLASAAGLCIAGLSYMAMEGETPRMQAEFFAARSLFEAHGRNIVNVILVDFRAFDTLGEITVLAAAAVAILVLLKGPPEREVGGAVQVSVIFRASARFLKPLILLFSLFLLVTGHHAPGGGFVGGLMAASAYILLAMGEGVAAARRALPVSPRVLVGLGLGIGLAAGLPGLAAGKPFLSGLWGAGPASGLGTPLLFDIGVYLLVAGVTLVVLLEFGEL